MDLYAYVTEHELGSGLSEYIAAHYGTPPRDRGALLMKLEEPMDDPYGVQDMMFNSHCGEDVVFVHTRCGGCGDECDEDSNYQSCGGREWEEANADTFLEHVTDEYDCTYMDHYFRAVEGEDYQRVLEGIRAEREQLRERMAAKRAADDE